MSLDLSDWYSLASGPGIVNCGLTTQKLALLSKLFNNPIVYYLYIPIGSGVLFSGRLPCLTTPLPSTNPNTECSDCNCQ